jgi:enoyl-CoA hydratase/carnithine racemase
MGINTSPYQNGDPRIGLGIVQSLTHTNMGFIPIWGPTELIPKLERHSKWGPHIGMGIPISVWVGICQYSKSGSPHTNMGFIPIWGPTYMFERRMQSFGTRFRHQVGHRGSYRGGGHRIKTPNLSSVF